MLISSAQPFKPSEKYSTQVYQVPYEQGFEEKQIARSMRKDKNESEDQTSGFEKLNSIGELHANFCRGLLAWEGMNKHKYSITVDTVKILHIKPFYGFSLITLLSLAASYCLAPYDNQFQHSTSPPPGIDWAFDHVPCPESRHLTPPPRLPQPAYP